MARSSRVTAYVIDTEVDAVVDIDTPMYAFTYNASCHSDGSGDTSHATSDLIDPIHPR